MIRVAAEDLEPGMVLAAPIPHPGSSQLYLLNAGYRLEREAIAQFPRYGIRYAWIRHPGFDFLDDRLGTALPEARVRLYHNVKSSFTGIANRTAGAFDLAEYRLAVAETIEELIANRHNAVWAERLMDGPDELFAHSANVAYLSLVIGLHLKGYIREQRKYVSTEEADDLTNLGIGAMLHDLGKLGLDSGLWGRHVFEKFEHYDTYRSHAELGYNALRGRIEATAAGIVLHHHQRFDGQGFPPPKRTHRERHPDPIARGRIHIFCRIVAVANVLDAMISLCHRHNRPTVAALATMQSPFSEGMFDPVVLRAALNCFPPFPLGTRVTLSDGRAAIVIDLNRRLPCQPRVQILKPDGESDKGECEQVDLAETGAPRIAFDGGRPVDRYMYTLTDDAESATDAPAPALPF